MEIPFFMYIIRKLAFGFTFGLGVFGFFLFGRPFVERITGMTFTDDVWAWYVLAGAIAMGLLAFLII